MFSKKLGLWKISFSLLYHNCLGKFEDVSDEIAESVNIDIKDSVLRITGITGVLFFLFGGFMVAGGRIHWLIHAPEIIIVFSSVFFGLLSTYRAEFLTYVPKALKACVVKPKPNADDCEISECGRRYAAVGGGLVVLLAIINTMGELHDPPRIGRTIAASLSGVVFSVLVSQLLFVYLRHSFAGKKSNS